MLGLQKCTLHAHIGLIRHKKDIISCFPSLSLFMVRGYVHTQQAKFENAV